MNSFPVGCHAEVFTDQVTCSQTVPYRYDKVWSRYLWNLELLFAWQVRADCNGGARPSTPALTPSGNSVPHTCSRTIGAGERDMVCHQLLISARQSCENSATRCSRDQNGVCVQASGKGWRGEEVRVTSLVVHRGRDGGQTRSSSNV